MYKNIHGLSPAGMGEVFKIETISFLAPKVWDLVPGKIKKCFSLETFESKLRKSKLDCQCRSYKTYDSFL